MTSVTTPTVRSVLCTLTAMCASLTLLACGGSNNNGSDTDPDIPPPVMSQTYGPEVEPEQVITQDDLTNPEPLVPADIYRISGAQGPSHQDLATFAWLEFIALVAQGNESARGTPVGSFAASGSGSPANLTWETFQHRTELFPFSATGVPVAPQPWNNAPLYEVYITSDGESVAYTVPFDDFNNLDEANQIGKNTIFFPDEVSAPNPVNDYQLLFEAKVNQNEWEFVSANYADDYPQGIELPTQSMEVKATWRPLESIPTDQQYRFYISDVITYSTSSNGSPVAQMEQYALVGLHIIHKTENYPTFVFATFEQVDMLSDANGAPTGLYYVPTYEQIAYQLNDTTTVFGSDVVDNPVLDPPFSTTAPKAYPNGVELDLPVGDVTTISNAVPFNETDTGGDQISGVIIPVIQPDTTNTDVAAVNAQVLTTMESLEAFDANFIWQYYKLKGVQAVPSSDDSVKDFYLANIGTESSQPSVQLFRGGAEQSPETLYTSERNAVNVIDPMQDGAGFSHGGCLGCHGIAQTAASQDFSFLFGNKATGFTPTPKGL